jgi:LSD1 subclass zinc finger protein
VIQFLCSSCHMLLSVPHTRAGRRVKCPFCAGPTAVPVQEDAASRSRPRSAGWARMVVAGMSAVLGVVVWYCWAR